MISKDVGQWKCRTKLAKYHEVMEPGKEEEFYATHEPYEVEEIEGNALVAAGIDVLWNLVCAGGGTSYGGINDNIEVYIVTVWVAGVADGAYPTYGSASKAVWKASWTGASGDGVWSKWAVTNGVQHLNEKTEALGTKSGGTWTLEVEISLS